MLPTKPLCTEPEIEFVGVSLENVMFAFYVLEAGYIWVSPFCPVL
jgi:hypothetical protein